MCKERKVLLCLVFIICLFISNLYSKVSFAEDIVVNTATLTEDFNGTHDDTQAVNDSVILEEGTTITIDHTTPVSVIGSAYDTSGNGGRKLVRLSNGWLIAGVYDSIGKNIRFYKSEDNGATWSQVCYINTTYAIYSFAMVSDETTVYIVYTLDSPYYGYIHSTSFNAITQENTNIEAGTYVESYTKGGTNSCSLAIDSNGHLHAVWSCKNATYPNSFNIRYSKSIDGGTTWASPTQITTANNTKFYYNNPCIVIREDNNPAILIRYGGDAYIIRCRYFDGDTWKNGTDLINISSSYLQDSPCAVVDGNGDIHVVWHGKDATDGTYHNIRYSKSADGGETWATPTKLTTGNQHHQTDASITVDGPNNVYVLWHGYDPVVSASYHNIRKRIYSGETWGSITTLTNNTTAHADYPQTCENFTDFAEPLVIWQDNQVGAVKFYGKWQEASGYLTSGTYTHNEVDISSAVVANNVTISYNKTTPANTSCTVDVRIFNGTSWSGWATKNSGDNLIPIGTNLNGYKVQWRANLGTTDPLVTPSLDDVTIANLGLVSVTGISLNKTSTNIAVGKTETLIATINPTDATNKNVTWASNDTAVATVANDGTVTGIGAGTATITATSEDGSFTATCGVNVRVQTIYTYQYEYDPNGSLIKVIIAD